MSSEARDTLKIKGKGVSAIVKTLQNDFGAPHHFLDFRFELVNENLGRFWGERCGSCECTKKEVARAVYAWEISIDEGAQPPDRSRISQPVWVKQLLGFTHRPLRNG